MNKAKNFVMTLVNPWFTLNILIESLLLCLPAHNRVKMGEIQRSKTRMVIGTDPFPNEEWPRKRDCKIHPGKGCLRRLWWRPVESWVAGKEQAEVHSLFFLQESWGSTGETTKPLVQQDQKMFFFIVNWLGELTRVCCGYSKYLCWRGERADSEVEAEPNM